MESIRDRFIRLLRLELESLTQELQLLMTTLDRRLLTHEITDYVRNENHAFFRNELLGVHDLLDHCGVAPPVTLDLEALAAFAKRCLRERLVEHGYVPALCELVDVRIDKIVTYLKLERQPVRGHA